MFLHVRIVISCHDAFYMYYPEPIIVGGKFLTIPKVNKSY